MFGLLRRDFENALGEDILAAAELAGTFER